MKRCMRALSHQLVGTRTDGVKYQYPVADVHGIKDGQVLGQDNWGNKTIVSESIEHMRERCKILRFTTPPSQLNRKYALGFVPTMGNLHDGHMALIEASQAECAFTAVSIFVNPTQFGPNEDFDKYPRTIERDLKLLIDAEVDAVWLPTKQMMYPEGYKMYVEYEGIHDHYEAKNRKDFFRGVSTVCTKLFTVVNPNVVYVGQKDALQCVVLKRLVEDFNMECKVTVCPTVREEDGLAFSSRNQYLSPTERKEAVVLYRALREAKVAYEQIAGEEHVKGSAVLPTAGELRRIAGRVFEGTNVKPIYIGIGRPLTMKEIPDEEQVPKGSFIHCAAMLGTTRLLDVLRLGFSEDDYW
eukprot:Sspe_Gene.36955::Locus_17854_Transcript_1_1_Confidence_1.000_Length_1162::g.36955::m.36955/K01918/panC; pantoate--beta-alanine ligase